MTSPWECARRSCTYPEEDRNYSTASESVEWPESLFQPNPQEYTVPTTNVVTLKRAAASP